jgi:transposase-like protein
MKPADIPHQLCEEYGEHDMSDSMLRRWVRHFNEGHKNVHDDPWNSQPPVVNEDFMHAVEEKIQEKRRFTISSLSLHFPQISGHFFTKLCQKNFI